MDKFTTLRRWLSFTPHRREASAISAIKKMNREQLISTVPSYFWWHSIDLGDGIITPGVKTPDVMAREFENTFSPIVLTGKSVLDLGTWNSGFAIEAVRRGAARVVALDHHAWNNEHFKARETFELACRATGVNIEKVDIDLDHPRLRLSHLGQFDVVLFLGVFYHLINPIGALREIVPLVRELLVLETHIDSTCEQRPAMVLYPGTELAGDPTNWWGPNTACIQELLGLAGFGRIDVTPGSSEDREVFHAYRTV